MDLVSIVKEGFTGSLLSVLQIGAIVIPLMIFIELIKDLNILSRLTIVIRPAMRIFQLPSEASLPLLAGLIFGITYGAGVILQAARDGHLSKRDLYLISTFLVIFHSLFEDTMLFVAIGANGFILIFVRLILAVGITFIAARFAFHEQKQSLHR